MSDGEKPTVRLFITIGPTRRDRLFENSVTLAWSVPAFVETAASFIGWGIYSACMCLSHNHEEAEADSERNRIVSIATMCSESVTPALVSANTGVIRTVAHGPPAWSQVVPEPMD
jgi:hypothetical protein